MSLLNNAGWTAAPAAENADLIIVNSCGFIESAKQESINAVLLWRRLYPEKKILLAGCLSQRYAQELTESLPEADGFFGNADLAGIAAAAAGIVNGKGPGIPAAPMKEEAHTSVLQGGRRPLLSLPGSAYVKISEGCSNCCSFCAIPLIRGGLVSREIPDIITECRDLLERGIRELCIIGQDIGSFGADKYSASRLPDFLTAISSLKGDFWVRLLYIHPDHFPLSILEIIEKDQRILPYFDIPFQHASAKMLKAMNRGGNASKHLELLETIRSRIPGAVIRSTFLLGFPGETDEDFAELLDFQEKARLDWLGCFTYSREEGTAAYPAKGRVPKKVAAGRRRIIEERQSPITEKNMDRFVGLTLDALIEEQMGGSGLTDEDIWLGRLYCQAPEIDGCAVIAGNDKDGAGLAAGTLVPCRVVARCGIDLEVLPLRPGDYGSNDPGLLTKLHNGV